MTLGWEMIAMSDWEVNRSGTLKTLDEKDIEIQRLRGIIESIIAALADDFPGLTKSIISDYEDKT